jgi:hypothetical protein
MYGWNERPSKVEPKHLIGGDNPARVFEVGKYLITVPNDPEADVTYHVPHWRSGQDDPRQTFPNMQVTDGEVRFPVEDLVPVILSRLEPLDLAQALWQNDEVRAHFIDCVVTRYSEAGIDDKDRRKLIIDLQSVVHVVALDKAVNMLGNLEQRFGSKWFFWNQIAQVEAVIKNCYPEAEGVRVMSPDSDEQFKCVGKNWNEARNHWREELLAMFPAPSEAE